MRIPRATNLFHSSSLFDSVELVTAEEKAELLYDDEDDSGYDSDDLRAGEPSRA